MSWMTRTRRRTRRMTRRTKARREEGAAKRTARKWREGRRIEDDEEGQD